MVSHGQSGQLAMSSQIQYSTVIQGAIDPVTAFIYNTVSKNSAKVLEKCWSGSNGAVLNSSIFRSRNDV